MSALHELQGRMAAALLAPPEHAALAVDDLVVAGRIPLARRLGVHRNTVRGALCRALALRYPTVERLVGEAFFDQAALAYAVQDWPREPQLAAWGAGFAGFLAGHAPAAALPYLADVARFDALLEDLSREPPGGARPRRFHGDWPVDEIRCGVLAGDDAALGAIDMTRRPLVLLAWRDGAQLRTRRLAPHAPRMNIGPEVMP
jgi:hypothetical protein